MIRVLAVIALALAPGVACAKGAAPLPSPDAVAQVAVIKVDDGLLSDPVDLVLTLTRRWEGQGLAAEGAQLDPVTTWLVPAVEKRAGTTTWWFTGYRLSQHEQPGDTLVICSLLIEATTGDRVSGYWHENHQAVPTTLWRAEGTWTGAVVDLSLQEVTDPGFQGTTGTVSGLVRPGR